MALQVLYVCNEDQGTTCQRLMALKDLKVETDVVYTFLLNEKISFFTRLKRALVFRLGYFPERNNENKAINKAISEKQYDILFIEKGLSIEPSTLLKVKKKQPSIRIVSYTLDDVMNKRNSSIYFRKSIGLYDFYFTNKKYNVEELLSMGAKNVHYFPNGYSSHVHRPVITTEREKQFYGAEVALIGSYEKERVELIRYLAENDIRVKIWGWGRNPARSGMNHPNITFTGKYVYGDEYAKVVCSTDINLCFLRKENRDTETTRSIEIPACGGFMLAERTIDHQALFEENQEAVYFSSREELLEKINYYLKHTQERERIGLMGLERCIKSQYCYRYQLKNIFSTILGNDSFSHY